MTELDWSKVEKDMHLHIVEALLCIAAVLPAGMYLPGGQPKHWYGDIREMLEVFG